MRLGLVGIDRRGEANAVLGGKAERVVVELGQVAEHLDELEADGLGGDEEPVEIAIELRLATDELKLAAAKVVGFTHEPVVVGRRQEVAIAGMRVGLGVAMNALQIAAVGQLKPQKIEGRAERQARCRCAV